MPESDSYAEHRNDEAGRGATANGRAAEVTAESPTDNHVTATPEPQAMEVSAGSSTDEPGSSYVGPFIEVDEKPIRFTSTTSVVQPCDTSMHRQLFTAMGQVSSTYPQVTTGFGTVPMPITYSRDRYCNVVLPLNPPIDTVTRNRQIAGVMRAWILLAYEAADIALQPDSDVMLTHPDGPDFFNTPCRETMAIWHEPFYLRLMLASWKHVAEASYYERLYNREAKKPRTEH